MKSLVYKHSRSAIVYLGTALPISGGKPFNILLVGGIHNNKPVVFSPSSPGRPVVD